MIQKKSDLYLLSDSIFSWHIESLSHHSRRTCCFVFSLFSIKQSVFHTTSSFTTTKKKYQCSKSKSLNNVPFILQNGKSFLVNHMNKASNHIFLFLSGMSLCQVIKLLKQNDEQIKSVVLVYNDKVKET